MYDDATYWVYEKVQEDGKIKTVSDYTNDFDGSITGHIVFGVKQWFDENPEERIRLGWVKHIKHNPEKWIEWNHQTQYLETSNKIIDPHTYEDEYHVMDKTEAMLRAAEEEGIVYSVAFESEHGVMWR